MKYMIWLRILEGSRIFDGGAGCCQECRSCGLLWSGEMSTIGPDGED